VFGKGRTRGKEKEGGGGDGHGDDDGGLGGDFVMVGKLRRLRFMCHEHGWYYDAV
jgi:hypothetical protein